MKLAIFVFLMLGHVFREGASSENCSGGWRALGGRCVGRGSELQGTRTMVAVQGFEGARGTCARNNASLLVISLADISALLAFTGWEGDKETYFWVGGVDDQTTAPGSSDGILQHTGEEADGMAPCWAARFQGLNEFIELTRTPCETALDFICQKPMLSECNGAHCGQMRKVRAKRQVHQDPFQPLFGDVLSVGRRAKTYDHFQHFLNNANQPSNLNPFPPVTFSNHSSNHLPIYIHHVVVPDHQGGNAVNFGTLFATDRGDRSNLRTGRTSSSTPLLQDLPNAEGLDFTDNLQTRENYSLDAKTTKSAIQVNPTSSYVENTSKPSNQMNASFHLTTSSPVRATTLPNARPGGHQIIFLPQSTRRLQFVTPSPILQFTTKGGNRAVVGDAASPGGGCASPDHLAFWSSCYVIIRKRDSFMSGLHACMNINPQAHSAIINDGSEGNILRSYITSEGESVWLGLFRQTAGASSSDAFRWLDGTPLTYSSWALHEPASIGDCVYAINNGRGRETWFAEDCNTWRSMLCEYPRKMEAVLSVPASSSAIFSPCAGGWSYNSKTYSCYRLMTHGGQTQAVAENNCQLFGGHLSSIGSQDEANFIRKVVESSSFAYTTFWVGLQETENGHEWVDGSAAVYLQWRRGQPNSHQGRETCTTAYKRTMELSDTYCQAYFAYMCKAPAGMSTKTPELGTVAPAPPCPTTDGWVLHKDNCYKVFSRHDGFLKAWEQARLHCRESRASLASVLDEEENAFMLSQVYTLSDEFLWLGGYAVHDTGYTWTDGSPFLFINWKMGEPNNYNGQESCLSMYPGDEAYWNDENCGILAGWVCKKPALETSTTATSTLSSLVGHCGQGWVNTGKKCVKLYEAAMNFEDARRTCKLESTGADLVSIADKRDQAVLSSLVGPMSRGVWLGMAYNTIYSWVDQSPAHYANWAPGEPNNYNRASSMALASGSSFKAAPILRNLFLPHVLDRIRWKASSTSQSQAHGREERSSSFEHRPKYCVEMLNSILGNKWNDVLCDTLLPFVCQNPLGPYPESSDAPATCGEPFASYLNYSGACYRYVAAAVPWQDAAEHCRSEGAELVTIETISQNSYAYLLAEAEGPQKVWIGFRYVNRSDRFEWTDGHPTLYTNWGAEEPKTAVGGQKQLCVTLSIQGIGVWQTEGCNETLPFICKYSPEVIPTPDTSVQGGCPDEQWADLGGSFCYFVDSKDHFTWDNANRQCQQMSAELVSIHSAVEMDYMARLMARHHVLLWAGLIRGAETFIWSDGSPYDYTHWAPFEPNGANEKCVEMLPGERTWNDVSCDVLRGFVCKIAKAPYPETTPGPQPTSSLEKLSQRQKSGPQLGKGGIVALVLASLVLMAAVGYVFYTYRSHLRVGRPALRPAAATSFDNALYNPESLEDPILEDIQSSARSTGAVKLSVAPS